MEMTVGSFLSNNLYTSFPCLIDMAGQTVYPYSKTSSCRPIYWNRVFGGKKTELYLSLWLTGIKQIRV